MIKVLRLTPYIALVCGMSVNVSAEDADLKQLSTEIQLKQSTPASEQAAIEAGRERALLCSVCHGKDGNSVKPDVPNLAGQNPVYLLDQIKKFADGRRKNFVMNSLSKNLTSDDKINLAIFYNSMKVKAASVDPQLAANGKTPYEQKCSSCHGKQGLGSTQFARLAGQQPAYVVMTLKRFRDNANQNGAANSKRSSNIMEAIVKQSSDSELESIAAYVAQLQ